MHRVECLDFCLAVVINTSEVRVSQRPVEPAQFTSTEFTKVPLGAKVKISMGGVAAGSTTG